jgi:hypothetical protein
MIFLPAHQVVATTGTASVATTRAAAGRFAGARLRPTCQAAPRPCQSTPARSPGSGGGSNGGPTPTAVPLHSRFGSRARSTCPWRCHGPSRLKVRTLFSPYSNLNPLLHILTNPSFFLDQRVEWADGSEKSHLLLLKGTDTIPIPATPEALIFLLLGSSRPIPSHVNNL